jgi:hypothetical protein
VAALHVCATPISERVRTPLCWTQLMYRARLNYSQTGRSLLDGVPLGVRSAKLLYMLTCRALPRSPKVGEGKKKGSGRTNCGRERRAGVRLGLHAEETARITEAPMYTFIASLA